ncbi:hypothetical protein BDV97DRAFT_369882 [Delphinella strobiligena]|nr:hypothetical protein BDV97DRAFT_369882 [Delphinella strobiligena]
MALGLTPLTFVVCGIVDAPKTSSAAMLSTAQAFPTRFSRPKSDSTLQLMDTNSKQITVSCSRGTSRTHKRRETRCFFVLDTPAHDMIMGAMSNYEHVRDRLLPRAAAVLAQKMSPEEAQAAQERNSAKMRENPQLIEQRRAEEQEARQRRRNAQAAAQLQGRQQSSARAYHQTEPSAPRR